MIGKMLDSKKMVSNILEKFPECRDCDKKLWLAYLVLYCDLKKRIGADSYNEFKKIILDKNTVTTETITRVRRKLQEQGFFQGKRLMKRKELESETRQNIHLL